MLKGGGGEDTLNGGTGIDTAAYNQSAAGVNVFLITGTGFGGDAEGDELNSIENLIGSSYNDQLWGDNGVNVLKGENGDDTLKGYGGEDTLLGGNNNDSCTAWTTTTRSTAKTATTRSMAEPATTP